MIVAVIVMGRRKSIGGIIPIRLGPIAADGAEAHSGQDRDETNRRHEPPHDGLLSVDVTRDPPDQGLFEGAVGGFGTDESEFVPVGAFEAAGA